MVLVQLVQTMREPYKKPLIFLIILLSLHLSMMAKPSFRQVETLPWASSPLNNNRYVDIWYNKIAGHTAMWVANRHHPINSTAGILSITTNGSLVITNGNSTTNRNLTGWSSSTDPSPGNYTLTVDRRDAPQLIFWAGSFRVWRSGPWTGVTPFNDPYSTVTSSFNFVRKKEEVSYSVGVVNNSIITRLLVDPSGTQRADRIST